MGFENRGSRHPPGDLIREITLEERLEQLTFPGSSWTDDQNYVRIECPKMLLNRIETWRKSLRCLRFGLPVAEIGELSAQDNALLSVLFCLCSSVCALLFVKSVRRTAHLTSPPDLLRLDRRRSVSSR